MSDDLWRRRERDADDTSEFGGPLFPDDPAEDRPARRGDNTAERRLSFGPNDTGPLPHWTDPPTGEIPRLAPVAQGPTGNAGDDDDDVDVWSSFTTETPIWRDDEEDADPTSDPSGRVGADLSASGGFPRDPALPDEGDDMTGEVPRDGISEPMGRPRTAEVPMAPPPPRREPGRITIGTDPAGVPRRDPTGGTRRRSGQQRSGRPAGPPRTSGPTAAGRRDLPMAIAVAAVLAVAFILLTRWKPAGVVGLITVVLAVAGFEYFGKITEKGYRPAVAPGLAAVVAAPLAAYWVGETAIPLIVAFAFIAGAVGFVGAGGVESGPLPNMAVTTLGVVWIGVLGSYAALIVRWSSIGAAPLGTDTLFLIVLGVAANDIGALAVGSTLGRTPLRAWISPGKTLEGVLGGAVVTILALFIYTRVVDVTTWMETRDVLLLGLVIAVMAPLGDLTESMFKRNIDVKDFGTVVAGHGGVLDRFDSFLFVLPAAYYLTLVLEPWTG